MKVLDFRELVLRSIVLISASDGSIDPSEIENASKVIDEISSDQEIASTLKQRFLDLVHSLPNNATASWVTPGMQDLTQGQVRILIRAIQSSIEADQQIHDSEISSAKAILGCLNINDTEIMATAPRLGSWLLEQRKQTLNKNT